MTGGIKYLDVICLFVGVDDTEYTVTIRDT